MMDGRRLARTSLIGFIAGGLLFGALGVYMNASIGAPAISNLGPTLVLVVIGGTVAGLIAPMIRRHRGE